MTITAAGYPEQLEVYTPNESQQPSVGNLQTVSGGTARFQYKQGSETDIVIKTKNPNYIITGLFLGDATGGDKGEM